MFNRHLTFAALATAAAICTAFGQSGAVSGTVRGADGKPAQGAQIRFEGKERSNFTTTTDAHGKYAYKGLPVGLYKISVLINGSPKSSVTVKTAAETARVDFDLKTSAKGVKHYVWVPARTGSRLGGGWVEVDSSGSPVGGTQHGHREAAHRHRPIRRYSTAPIRASHGSRAIKAKHFVSTLTSLRIHRFSLVNCACRGSRVGCSTKTLQATRLPLHRRNCSVEIKGGSDRQYRRRHRWEPVVESMGSASRATPHNRWPEVLSRAGENRTQLAISSIANPQTNPSELIENWRRRAFPLSPRCRLSSRGR